MPGKRKNTHAQKNAIRHFGDHERRAGEMRFWKELRHRHNRRAGKRAVNGALRYHNG